MLDLKGLFPPIPTPFEGDKVAPEFLVENIAMWNEEPLDGYVVLGSNGEFPLLDEEERRSVIRAARKAIPRGKRLMIVGTARESTALAVRATKEAFDMGADAVLLGVPTYYRPEMNDAALEGHLRAVADASPGPVILYSVPQFTGIPLMPALAASLAGHDRVAGIKDSGGEIANLLALVDVGKRAGKPFQVLIGSARILAAGILGGASGAVLAVSSVAPRRCAEIVSRARRGDGPGALMENERLLPLAGAVTREHGIGGLKAALDLLSYHGGDPRPPLRSASSAARLQIASHLRTLGLLT
jgi:4-hydroxy-2-oxoglutarate aldolase